MMVPSNHREKTMPLIQITLSGAAAEADAVLQRETTRLMREVLKKDAALTVVAISHLASGAFSADGRPVPVAASLVATITAGTNSTAEKAAFIAEATRMINAAIGPSAAPVYVALQELPTADWGYDGRSQAARKAAREAA